MLRIGREKVRERKSLIDPKMGLGRQGGKRQDSRRGDILIRGHFNFCKCLYSKTNSYMHLRIGFSDGKLL